MDRFAKNLTVLGKSDIYDFLGCLRTQSPSSICAMADAELEKARKAPSKTAEVSARQELAGLITSYFKKKDAKEAYNLALRTYVGQKRLDEVFSIRCVSRTIDWKAYQESISDCRAIGMSREEAEYFVYDFYCVRRKCPPPAVPDKQQPAPALHYCKACLTPNPEGATSCRKCGTPFKVHCPKCGQECGLENSFCVTCAFPIGDMPLALKLLKEGRLLASAKDFANAEKMIDRALVYWPNNRDCLSVKIEIEQSLKKEQAAMEQQERKAREAAAKPHLDNIHIPGAVKAVCSVDGSVTLTWSSAAVRNPARRTDPSKISYIVIRKSGAVPSTPQDGERLVETRQLRFEDTSCVPGVGYGYAVFPGYAGVPCKDGMALIGGVVPVLPCVTNATTLRRHGTVEVSWDWPQGCTEVKLLWRTDTTPESANDKDAAQVSLTRAAYNRDGAYIISQAGNLSYYFSIFAVVRARGQEIVSAPQTCVSVGESERRTLTYSFQKKKRYLFFGDVTHVTLAISVSDGTIPELTLIKKFGRQPLSRQDGALCCRIPASNESRALVPLPDNIIEHGAFLKLFLSKAEWESVFRINHPGFTEMKI